MLGCAASVDAGFWESIVVGADQFLQGWSVVAGVGSYVAGRSVVAGRDLLLGGGVCCCWLLEGLSMLTVGRPVLAAGGLFLLGEAIVVGWRGSVLLLFLPLTSSIQIT